MNNNPSDNNEGSLDGISPEEANKLLDELLSELCREEALRRELARSLLVPPKEEAMKNEFNYASQAFEAIKPDLDKIGKHSSS